MFFTGSFDGVVAGWDTNECRRVVSFDMTDKIYAVGMSPVATSHALVACSTSDPRVRLCDPASGNVTHTFAGHRDAVWAVEWTRGSEWILATGGCDGDIRVWDIRRAGAFMVLDASNARDAALDPLAQATTHAPDVPQFAGPAPPTRRNVDAVPDHLFTDAAVRCRGGGYGGGSRASGAYRGGTYGHRAYASGGGAGGGGWGAGFRRRPGFGSGGGDGSETRVAVRPHPTGTRAHVGRVTALKATPDGLRLVSAGTDNRVRLWDLADGKNADARFGVAPNDAKKATTLAVTADGRRVYHPSSDGDVLVFDVPAALARGKGKGRGRGVRGEGDATEATATKATKTTRATRTTPSRARIASLVARAVAWWFAWAARNARARTPTRAASDRRPSPPPRTPRGGVRGGDSRRHGRGVHGRRGSTRARVETAAVARGSRARRRARRRRRRDVQTVSRRGGTQTRGVARAADEDDWSEDDADAVGVDPDPGADAVAGLGYRRGVDG